MKEKLYLEVPLIQSCPTIFFFNGQKHIMPERLQGDFQGMARYIKHHFYLVYLCEIYCDEFGAAKPMTQALRTQGVEVQEMETVRLPL